MPAREFSSTYCAQALKILADETRLAVMRQLLYRPKQVNELNASMAVSQSLLSHHLKVLRDARLVIARRVGKAVLYELSPAIRRSTSEHVIDLGCCRLDFANQRGEV